MGPSGCETSLPLHSRSKHVMKKENQSDAQHEKKKDMYEDQDKRNYRKTVSLMNPNSEETDTEGECFRNAKFSLCSVSFSRN